MARKPHYAPGGIAYHVMNRTWGNIKLFEDAGDYEAFERVLVDALDREPTIRLCAYCLMPNHFRLVAWPGQDGQLSRFMQWLTMTQTQRWHAHHHTGGRSHLYQSRFKSFPIQQDRHYLGTCRYVERNALRAGLVECAEQWRWGSLYVRAEHVGPMDGKLSPWPMRIPRDWLTLVNQPQDEKELAALRLSRDRGRPYGTTERTNTTARTLDIERSLRPVGRPAKEEKKAYDPF